jgi:hypothetical protein
VPEPARTTGRPPATTGSESAARPGEGSPQEAALREWARGGGPLAVRARVVLLAGAGLRDAEIARRLGVSRQTVGTWRHRWQSAGLAGLEQRPRTGRPVTVDEAEVVTRALLAPGGSGASRAIARELGLSTPRWPPSAAAGTSPTGPACPPGRRCPAPTCG